jgi:hypothetical protein
MKSNFFKTVFPVVMVLLAVVMAFNTNAMNKKRVLLETGWKHQTSATSCDNSPVECTRAEGDDCVDGTYVIYRKTLAGACSIKMFKPNN